MVLMAVKEYSIRYQYFGTLIRYRDRDRYRYRYIVSKMRTRRNIINLRINSIMYKINTHQTNSILLITLVSALLLAACGAEEVTQEQSLSLSAEPLTVTAVEGNIIADPYITIRGSDFTEKLNAQPLFYWRADDSTSGVTPSTLGRKANWDDIEFYGTPSTAIVAPGSQQSIAFDHGLTSGHSLSRIIIDSPLMYLHRKVYEDFDITKSFAIRTFVDTASIVGTISVGDKITGAASNATGTITRIYEDTITKRTTIWYENAVGSGTVADTLPLDFQSGETMTSSTGATMANIEPSGVERTFNFKIVRFWNKDGPVSDIFVSAQGAEKAQYSIHPEHTDRTVYAESSHLFPNKGQLPFKWNTQEIEYGASDIDTPNGQFNFYHNGEAISEKSKAIITRTTERPGLYNELYQSQVSNGAQLDSNIYYDSIYIDDTLHRVIICESSTWDACSNGEVQIPISWNNEEIIINTNIDGFDLKSPLFLYVFDQYGQTHKDGYPL